MEAHHSSQARLSEGSNICGVCAAIRYLRRTWPFNVALELATSLPRLVAIITTSNNVNPLV